MSFNDVYVHSKQNPQNFILRSDLDFFPKVKKLLDLKNAAISDGHTHEGFSLVADLHPSVCPSLGHLLGGQVFESILIDPPWYEYYARAGGFVDMEVWSVEELMHLRVGEIAAPQSFCFLWATSRHIEQATACLVSWGFKRIEDICWLKTNREAKIVLDSYLPAGSRNFFHSTKEHLLVGIKGLVSRSQDHHLIHSNIDDDVIIAEDPNALGSTLKPLEIYGLIERFCNSKRRIELFANSLRPGWVSVGLHLPPTTFDPQEYSAKHGGFVSSSPEIEKLRPKSPLRR